MVHGDMTGSKGDDAATASGMPSDAVMRRYHRIGLAGIVGTLLLDHLTKLMVLMTVASAHGIGSLSNVRAVTDPRLGLALPWQIEVTGFFNLVMVWNTGVSFGLFSGIDARWLLIVVSLAIAVALAIWMWRADNHWLVLALALVIGGAIGNVIDRFWHGAVVDFLDFHLYGWHWPAFNIADSAICIGVGVLLLDSLRPQRGVGNGRNAAHPGG